ALAALAATGAFAQSTVTIYGRAHVAFDGAYSATGGTNTAGTAAYDIKSRQRVSDDGSRIGLRISEDLGGGLRAFSVIETGINIDTATNNAQSGVANSGTGFFGTREAHVGIGNNMAELRLGRQNVFWGMGPTEDVSANRISGGVGSSYSAPSSGYTVAPAARLENTVQVVAGSDLGGFAGSAVWFAKPVAAETALPLATNTGNTLGEVKAAAQGFTLRYITGPFGVQYDYAQVKNAGNGITTASSFDATNTGSKLGLSYSYAPGSKVYFANAVFSTSFTDAAVNNVAPVSIVGTAATGNYNVGYRKQASNQFGVQHVVGGGLELHAQYVIQGKVKNFAGADVAATGSKAYAVGARYELSKRTALTASYNVIDNEAKNNINLSGGGQSSTPNIGLGATLKVVRASIQHLF
ncbi:MAG: porin, partial [Betaproteobacteria bacterium]